MLLRVGAKKITKEQARKRYMGNCVAVLNHFQDRGKNKVSTRKMRGYFRTTQGAKVWEELKIGRLEDFEFDHIYPLGNGGYEHPYNYFVMPRALNAAVEFKYFGIEKATYIGVDRNVFRDANNFMKWIRNRTENKIVMAEFAEERINM